jgi:hypothetical protein
VGLTAQEVSDLAKSVAGWVWKRFTPERFSARQAALGRKGAAATNANRVKVTPETLKTIEEAFSWQRSGLADYLQAHELSLKG